MRPRLASRATTLLLAWATLLIVYSNSPTANTDTDSARLDEALLSSDLVVIGTVDAVEKRDVEWASSQGRARTGESGHAELTVIETLWGTLDENATVRIAWTYIDGVDPAASRNPHRNGETSIYFLACPAGDNDEARGPQRCTTGEGEWAEQFHAPLDRREIVATHLARYPVRISGEPSYRAGSRVPITLTLANLGDEPIDLPRVSYEGGRLVHGSGLTFIVRKGSRTGAEALLRIGRIRTDSSLPALRLEPGGAESVVVDLQKLYGLMEPGYFVLEIGLDGLPPQRPFVFRLE